MNAVRIVINPQLTMIRAIHFRALQRSTMIAPGTSNSTYPTKNIPTPRPYTRSANPRSALMRKFANATLIRST